MLVQTSDLFLGQELIEVRTFLREANMGGLILTGSYFDIPHNKSHRHEIDAPSKRDQPSSSLCMQGADDPNPFSVPGANHQGSSPSYSSSLPRVPRPSCGAIAVLMFGSICVKPTFFSRSVLHCHNRTLSRRSLQIFKPQVAVCLKVRHDSSRRCTNTFMRSKGLLYARDARSLGVLKPPQAHNRLSSCGSLMHDACIVAMAYHAKLCFSDCLGSLFFLDILKRHMLSSDHDSRRSKAFKS